MGNLTNNDFLGTSEMACLFYCFNVIIYVGGCMAKKYLYHGTDLKSAESIVKNSINLSKSRSGLDFGKGFYLTNNFGQAKNWALRKDLRNGGTVISFSVEPQAWTALKKRKYNAANDEWGNVIFENRINNNDILDGYDVIIGPMADGDIAILTELAKASRITKDEFITGIKNIGIQFTSKTEKAVKSLQIEEGVK